ncbi:MAG: hypothetical protein A2315_09575 [Ignavibacteria bacterium RIFOXYB2_FULL_35_12]|nr:MAG: hypothetical protein A2058_14095 [Ignavibacteria bacterium GWA2_36_19]OGU54637.1 MAG: hypothetical protein A2006_07990 [Ignavibacteria bacterium GWC2_35_8]OGU62532.1 MAG: hypothetical protein A2X60_18100 [Ignavibacteria bacterium GWF2_35_20]OGU78728.1 MAG: hypothetical protein A2W11_05235 [Ignavibacteria bacterium RBG_16_35_7]OGU81763.1 MAG: hypothetical protein A2254_11515 [Ignavibacteria bacterium RIFOXYA2_FULL_35_9]OGU87590.1 MAG: hypothetical protein A3K31_03745 [Ignavibacteria bac
MTEVSKVLNDSARMDEDQFKEMISRNTFLPDARNSEILFVSDLDDEDEEEFEDEDGDEDEELFDEDEIEEEGYEEDFDFDEEDDEEPEDEDVRTYK